MSTTSSRRTARGRGRPGVLARWTAGWRGAIASLVVTAGLRRLRALFPSPKGPIRWMARDVINGVHADRPPYPLINFILAWTRVWPVLFIIFNRILPVRTHDDT